MAFLTGGVLAPPRLLPPRQAAERFVKLRDNLAAKSDLRPHLVAAPGPDGLFRRLCHTITAAQEGRRAE